MSGVELFPGSFYEEPEVLTTLNVFKEEVVVGILGRAERRKKWSIGNKQEVDTCCRQLQEGSCGGLNVSGLVQRCTEEDVFGCSSNVHGQMSFSQFC